MDFDESALNFDEMLRNNDFPAHFDQLELDSLLYGTDESQESSSSSFGFNDQNAAFRSRDGGSLGDSSTDSSPPLSCANFTENDQEMWDFGFQNNSPFGGSFDQQQFGTLQEDDPICNFKNDRFIERQYVEEEPVRITPNKIITILPKPQTQVKKVVSRPIQKVYRIREPVQINSYKVVQPINSNQRVTARPMVHKQEFYEEIPEQPRSGPLIRQVSNVSEDRRFVPIAPMAEIKQEQHAYSPEQNRKIRNRMYAQASRIRKKEAEESLRQNLQELIEENEQLKNENLSLRQRLSYYEKPQEPMMDMRPAAAGRTQKQKKMIAAGTVIMMFGLFAVISPFSVMTLDNEVTATRTVLAISNQSSIVGHRGRVIETGESTAVIRKPGVHPHFAANSSQNDCEMFKLNATETLRVNNDIERWVQVHSFDNVSVKFSGGLSNKEAMKKFNEARKSQKLYGPQTAAAQKKSEQAEMRSRERTWRQLDLLKTGNNIVDSEKIKRKRQNIDKIASVVRQKGDTLYIMTLQDYVLLPSLKKGGNSIPKLSLLLPSVPMNGTMLDQYSLLRVDCEVTGTGRLTLSGKQLSYLMP